MKEDNFLLNGYFNILWDYFLTKMHGSLPIPPPPQAASVTVPFLFCINENGNYNFYLEFKASHSILTQHYFSPNYDHPN